jgi:DNA-binding GntR family transcriptional regulator
MSVSLALRTNISTDVANTLRDMIFDRTLVEGARINEVHLAARLGISRTPLREALTTLVAEGALESMPRRGFFVRELTEREFRDIYTIRPLLDPGALRLSGIPTEAGFGRLERLNERMRAANRDKSRTTLDDQWHLELIRNCPNRVLIDLIRHFMGRFRRYGLAFLRDGHVLETANLEHQEILERLRQGDLDGACEALRRNLTSNTEPILAWLQSRGAE